MHNIDLNPKKKEMVTFRNQCTRREEEKSLISSKRTLFTVRHKARLQSSASMHDAHRRGGGDVDAPLTREREHGGVVQ